MCKWGTDASVTLSRPMPISGRTAIPVDACLAPLIQVLNDYGVHTIGCCCGHDQIGGSVRYEQDGQEYEIQLNAPELFQAALARQDGPQEEPR